MRKIIMILHITTHNDWECAQKEGEYLTASLASEGFIHCSTMEQVVTTANGYFKGQSGLALLYIDEALVISEIKYESPLGRSRINPEPGTLFPHIYGPINLSAVIKVVDFPPNENGFFTLPEQ